MAALARADLYVAVGVGFEHAWMGRIRAVNPGLRVLDTSRGLRLRRLEEHDHEDPGHAPGAEADNDARQEEPDPHLWTSPRLVKRMAEAIRDHLMALDPAHASDYEANEAAFAADLDTLDRDIRHRLEGLKNRRFLVLHPAWGYSADTYGLIQVAIEREGKEPGPRSLAALIDQARREGIETVLVQPQFSAKAAEQVAAAIGGRVEVADVLTADYFATLRRLAATLAVPEQP